MTFCRRVKQEISANAEFDNCCNAAHLYGILSFSKNFAKEEIVLSVLDREVLDHIVDCFRLFGISLDEDCISKQSRSYCLTIQNPMTIDRILSDFGYSGDEPNYRILDQNFMCDGCKAAYVSGCFLTGGTVTEPSRSYHLEFSTRKYSFSNDFYDLLTSCGFSPKVSERKSLNRMIYFKDSGQIEDVLTFMGAHSASMEVMNEKIYKDMINKVNRQTNCETANIDKIVQASEEDRKLISFVYTEAGESYFSENLREIAKLRVENPELSLVDLGKLLDPVLSKSGVSHRLRRIRHEAENLREQKHVVE